VFGFCPESRAIHAKLAKHSAKTISVLAISVLAISVLTIIVLMIPAIKKFQTLLDCRKQMGQQLGEKMTQYGNH
jgi:predicted PurR-regulated permease PerM